MKLIKRTTLTLKRNLGKAGLLFSLILLLGIFASSTIFMRQAVSSTQRYLRLRLPAIMTLNKDLDRMHQEVFQQFGISNWDDYDSLEQDIQHEIRAEIRRFDITTHVSPSTIHEIGALSQVYAYDVTQLTQVYGQYVFAQPDEFGLDGSAAEVLHGREQFFIQGVSRPDFSDLTAELIHLVEGRSFNESELLHDSFEYVAIVSSAFAQANSLSLDSVFTLENIIFEFQTDISILVQHSDIPLRIIGIFELSDKGIPDDPQEYGLIQWTLLNQMYVPLPLAQDARYWQVKNDIEISEHFGFGEAWREGVFDLFEEGFWSSVLFLLDDPIYFEGFEQAAQELLPPFWYVADLSGTFANISTTLDIINDMSSLFILLIAIVGVISMTLLIVMYFNDRKKEMGIYLALGETRCKIIFQLFLEIFIIGFTAISLALIVSRFLSEPISDFLLREQLLAEQTRFNEQEFNPNNISVFDPLLGFAPRQFGIDELLEDFNITLHPTTMTLIYGLGFLSIGLSLIIPSVVLFTYSPKKILE